MSGMDNLVLVPNPDGGVEVVALDQLVFAVMDDVDWNEAIENSSIESTTFLTRDRQAPEVMDLIDKVRRANASDDVGSTYWDYESDT